jgi:hypothetical protein
MSNGKIITFYSYKGGVGRTMALANVAFLAAMNGKRVLVMDWDLEAPGLHYYYKALLSSHDARQLRYRPGILDLLWRWTAALELAKTPKAVDDAVRTFSSDEYFSGYVIPVELENENHGSLDLITAGASELADRNPAAYGEALANFAWPSFFNAEAGGKLLQSLRQWAARKYDYVFIDSRTGMADVAGICTMQLPDIVALCFVLNRQNIDGTAGIAGAIRNRAGEAIKLFSVPMRVSASGTSEEADARARGIYELAKVGGFSKESAQEDFKFNSIRTASNVPYYETVLPIIATDPGTDPLLLNYLRMANRVLGISLEVPAIDPLWADTVRRRLQPKLATSEYVLTLQSADSLRAAEELQSLIVSATDTVFDGADLADDYLIALVQTALVVTKGLEGTFTIQSLIEATLDLVRAVYSERPDVWREFLIQVLERYLETNAFLFEDEEELAIVEELETLLSTSDWTSDLLKRARGRRRAAQLYLNDSDFDASSQAAAEWVNIVRELSKQRLDGETLDELALMDVEIHLLRGDIEYQQDNFPAAIPEYRKGVTKLNKIELASEKHENTEVQRLGFELFIRLSRISERQNNLIQAGQYIVEAVEYGEVLPQVATQFVEISNTILNLNNPEISAKYLKAMFVNSSRRLITVLPMYYTRSARSAVDFLQIVTRFAQQTEDSEVLGPSDLMPLIEASIGLGRNVNRRVALSPQQRDIVREGILGLVQTLLAIGIDAQVVQNLSSSFAVETTLKRPREAR